MTVVEIFKLILISFLNPGTLGYHVFISLLNWNPLRLWRCSWLADLLSLLTGQDTHYFTHSLLSKFEQVFTKQGETGGNIQSVHDAGSHHWWAGIRLLRACSRLQTSAHTFWLHQNLPYTISHELPTKHCSMTHSPDTRDRMSFKEKTYWFFFRSWRREWGNSN